jgi:hypothetical protein
VPRTAPAARRDRDLGWVLEVERQVLGGRIAVLRLRLEQTQHDLLQPLRNLGPQASRRHRVHPQALAQAAGGLRVAERQLAGQHLVQHDADREQVAARIAANAEHLLRRHVGMGTDRARVSSASRSGSAAWCESPKSSSTALPSSRRITFAGFRS